MNDNKNTPSVRRWSSILLVLMLIVSPLVKAESYTGEVSGLFVSEGSLGIAGIVRMDSSFECFPPPPGYAFPFHITNLFMEVTQDADAFNTQYALLLSALAMGQTVTFEYSLISGWFFQWCQLDSFTIN